MNNDQREIQRKLRILSFSPLDVMLIIDGVSQILYIRITVYGIISEELME